MYREYNQNQGRHITHGTELTLHASQATEKPICTPDMSRYPGPPQQSSGRPSNLLNPEELETELARVDTSLPDNHILLLTVLNPLQGAVNVDIIAKVCRGDGRGDQAVDKIVIFERVSRGARGIVEVVQALVEFKTVDLALDAKKTLHGCDIYSNACTLKVEFARQEKLNVKRNDEKTWDFTQNLEGPHTNGVRPPTTRRKVLLTEGPPSPPDVSEEVMVTSPSFPRGDQRVDRGGPGNGYNGGYNGYEEQQGQGGNGYNNGYSNGYNKGGMGGGYLGQDRSPVIIIYSLDPERFNCVRLFNLLCLYGNIERINFLKSKEGCAMVEFSDCESVDRVCRNLSQVKVWGARLRLEQSRKSHVEEIRKPHELPDGTDSFMNFYRDRNNRFDTPERAAKNRIIPPTKTLHFYNVPKMSDDNLIDIFAEQLAPCPVRVKWFDARPNTTSKAGSGVVDFETLEESCEALVTCNNLKVEGEEDDRPYDMKLCFSRTTN